MPRQVALLCRTISRNAQDSRAGVQVRVYLVRDFDAKQASGYVWTEGDVEWSPRNTIIFPALSSLAGLIAGMFGVGGGIVKVGASLSAK